MDHLPFVLTSVGVLLATYLLSLCTYRLYFSPVSHIPGPSLAKITYWYEFYYDVLLKGQYTFKIKRLHDKYGPIIRINPHEVHIQNPDFCEVVYADDSRCKRDKWSWSCRQYGLPLSTLATVGHDHHRLRWGALDPFFSKARVRSLQPVLEDVARKLLARFEEFQMLGESLPIYLAFAALTNDIAEQYVLGRNDKRALARDFDPSFYEASLASSATGYLTKHFPFITKLTQFVPDNLTILMKPATASYVKLRRDIKAQIEQIIRTENSGDDHTKSDTSRPSSHQHTLIHEILRSDLPDAEKSPARIMQDIQATVTAGTLATAAALSYTLFSLLSHPQLLRRLRTELHAAMPNPTVLPSLAVLEQLPFLTACIKEGLRLGIGANSRLQRIDPVNPIVFTAADRTEGKSRTYVLPAGTPLSMTGLLVHFGRDTFRNPGAFDPDRWLGSSTLDRYLVAFSKGPRQCVGIHLA
ncbi:Trichodiene oxygenase [Cladophialophora carrionii]|uniref:Trichodiene oxygenase n=1 Tax=Cladophialophora carrionii TaxID=86049 RepID=A0A1C1CGL7_9EURO|nr:Trichodiene oxygenase [Cladophialophora carrionii]